MKRNAIELMNHTKLAIEAHENGFLVSPIGVTMGGTGARVVSTAVELVELLTEWAYEQVGENFPVFEQKSPVARATTMMLMDVLAERQRRSHPLTGGAASARPMGEVRASESDHVPLDGNLSGTARPPHPHRPEPI